MAIAKVKSFSINGKAYMVSEVSYKAVGIEQPFLDALQGKVDITSWKQDSAEMEVTYYVPDGETPSIYNGNTNMTIVMVQADGIVVTLKSGKVQGAATPDPVNKRSKITVHSLDVTEEYVASAAS